MNRYLVPLAVVVLSSIGFMYCGSNEACGPANCGGCCNASGTCVSDEKNSECGRRGDACVACTGAQSCMNGTCMSATMGGGSGTTGGGSGTGGGTATGGGSAMGGGSATGGGTAVTCTTLDWSAAQGVVGSYQVPTNGNPPFNVALVGAPSLTANRVDLLNVEFWYFGSNQNATIPATVTITNDDWSNCATCLILDTGCDPMTGENCTKTYLGQSGSLQVTSATRNAAAGTFSGTGTAVQFREWNFTDDVAVAGGSCVTIPTFTFTTTWAPADAGVDGGTTVDAGVDAGMPIDAGTDAGMTIDAGTESDAGVDAGIELDAGLPIDAGIEIDAGVDAGIGLP